LKIDPELKEQLEAVQLYENVATQFLETEKIKINGEAYKAIKEALFSQNGFPEFFKAWQFEHGMINTIDYPDGILEKDVNLAYMNSYPTMAAVGIIEIANVFNKIALIINRKRTVTIKQCICFSNLFWQIKLLGNVMALKEARKKGAGAKQAERRIQAGNNTRIDILNAAEKLLADPSQRAACLRENDKFNVSRLWKAIKDNNPEITIKKTQGMSILRDLIKENHIK